VGTHFGPLSVWIVPECGAVVVLDVVPVAVLAVVLAAVVTAAVVTAAVVAVATVVAGETALVATSANWLDDLIDGDYLNLLHQGGKSQNGLNEYWKYLTNLLNCCCSTE